MIDGGDLSGAETVLAAIAAGDLWEWRVAWYRGLAAMAHGRPVEALTHFDAVYSSVPGELAPKLALGLASEHAGQLAAARRWYAIVARTDPSITCASFGLARCCLESGDRAAAIAAYEQLPDTSSGYVDAQAARIRCLNSAAAGPGGRLDDLLAAASILKDLPVDAEQRDRLTAELLATALKLTVSGVAFDDGRTTLLGHRLTEREIRLALEASYRALARRAGSRGELIELVDQANRTRPRTWV
jgi:serine/threonine-protein kinase PknG